MLSVESLPTSSIVTYNHDERCHTISIKDKNYHFKVPPGKKGLPVRRFPHVNPNLLIASHILANTVAQNESMYTMREDEEAKQAQELYRMLYPSKTCRRQYRAKHLSAAHLQFKALRDPTKYTVYQKASSKARPLIHLPCLTRSSQCLDQQVMTYTSTVLSSLSKESLSYSFGTPVNLLVLIALANRTVSAISKALDQHIANYRAHEYQVTEVLLDSESGLIATRMKFTKFWV